jgi:hypothetical protein
MQLRRIHSCLAIAPLGIGIFLCAAPNALAQRFPFGRDLVLDVNPMPFSERTPVLNVAENGTTKIDLWCNRGTAPVFVAANTITIGDGPMTLRECRLDHRHAKRCAFAYSPIRAGVAKTGRALTMPTVEPEIRSHDMSRKAWVIGVIVPAAVSLPVLLVSLATYIPLAPDYAELLEQPAQVRGTLDQVNGDLLTIKTQGEAPTTVQLKDDALIVATVKGAMADVRDNLRVTIIAVNQSGAPLIIRAVELHVFTEPLGKLLRKLRISFNESLDQRPPGLVYYYFVHKKVGENTLKLMSKAPDITCLVPSDARISKLIPGDKADLVPGTPISIPRWRKRADGTWEAIVAIVGRNGIPLPI